MMDRGTVLVGFSGGVDSSLTAVLLREQGWRVVAARMTVRGKEAGRQFGCGQEGDGASAEKLAHELGLELLEIDCSDAYHTHVLGNFRSEYLSGRTPNPCIICNPVVKFGLLPLLARGQGIRFNRFATGHYARIQSDSAGRPRIFRGADHSKDQSYFLYRLKTEQLAMTMLPLGGYTKSEVRRMAAERGIPVHDKPDSQDFYAGDYADLLGVKEQKGEIVNAAGAVLGTHDGFWRFTPGQRKGLGVAHTEPLYVIRVIPERNQVVVGTREEQLGWGCVATDLVFQGERPEAGTDLRGKIRSAQPLRAMRVEQYLPDGSLSVRFAEPVHGIAPGQSLVLYDGDMVIGGGIIQYGM